MRLALFAVGAIAVVLTGCGQANVPKDPFEGTWRMNSGDRVRWVISRHDGQYNVVQGWVGNTGYARVGAFARHGDRLSGSWRVVDPTTGKPAEEKWVTLTVGKATGQLRFHYDATTVSKPFDTTMTKLSDSTSTPNPVP